MNTLRSVGNKIESMDRSSGISYTLLEVQISYADFLGDNIMESVHDLVSNLVKDVNSLLGF